MVQLTYRAPYARPEGGLGRVFKENVKKREMAVATGFSLIVAVFLLRFWGAVLWLTLEFQRSEFNFCLRIKSEE